MATRVPITSAIITRMEPTTSQARAAHLISPSCKVPLLPGQKIKDTDYERAQRPYTIQQLVIAWGIAWVVASLAHGLGGPDRAYW